MNVKRCKNFISKIDPQVFYQRIFLGVMGTPAFSHLMSLGIRETRPSEVQFICDEFAVAGIPIIYDPDRLEEIEEIAWHASQRAIALQFRPHDAWPTGQIR